MTSDLDDLQRICDEAKADYEYIKSVVVPEGIGIFLLAALKIKSDTLPPLLEEVRRLRKAIIDCTAIFAIYPGEKGCAFCDASQKDDGTQFIHEGNCIYQEIAKQALEGR